jgi:hypothetical protein
MNVNKLASAALNVISRCYTPGQPAWFSAFA